MANPSNEVDLGADNQADWLGKLLDQFDPIDISHHDFERLKPQAIAKLEALLRRVEVERTKHQIDKAQSNLRRKYQLTRSERYGMDILSDEVREQLKELREELNG